jgi:hypothetical protein
VWWVHGKIGKKEKEKEKEKNLGEAGERQTCAL